MQENVAISGFPAERKHLSPVPSSGKAGAVYAAAQLMPGRGCTGEHLGGYSAGSLQPLHLANIGKGVIADGKPVLFAPVPGGACRKGDGSTMGLSSSTMGIWIHCGCPKEVVKEGRSQRRSCMSWRSEQTSSRNLAPKQGRKIMAVPGFR